MSHQTYNNQWREAQEILTETLQIEPVQADRREQRQLLAILYIKYILISNKLNECIDLIIQPQKRRLIRKLLEATLGRILELKSDLTEADLNEYTHCGDVLELIKTTPFEIELKIPTCFREERQEIIDKQQKIIDNVLEKLGYIEKPMKKAPLTEQQAILIIQVHERARQGRLRAQFMREVKSMKDKTKHTTIDVEGGDQQKRPSLNAVLLIQKIWRGYVTRRQTRRRKYQEMLLIGMIPPVKIENEEFVKDAENRERRKLKQKQEQKRYEEAVEKCRSDLEKHQKGVIFEQLSDQVRGWLYEYREQTGKIPEYTGSERTQSRLLLSRQGTDSETSKSTLTSSKDSKTKRSGKIKEIKKTENNDDEEQSTKATVSIFLPELNVCKEEYEEIWRNKDETENFQQTYYIDMIEHEQMLEMENQIRKVVDEMMKNELLLLQDALDRDRGHKTRKKASKKTRKSSKRSKKKKEKDLTPDRTPESLFEELIANGIIKRYPHVYLNDFKGERSYNPPVPHNKDKNPPIALGDVRQIITEFCIIPLLSSQIHQLTPHIKSLLLCGPKGSGKDMLVHAVCTETGAILFDITPANIVGKYPGKSGLIMLIHLITKVARLYQPAIIYMDCAERPFVKKIPKTDKTDPRRLKKDLPKIVKNFSSEDRIMLIGCSNCPWESDQKLLQQVYQKFILIPKPDYSSRYFIWNFQLGKYSAINWQFDVSGISKISDGYTVGSIVETVDEIMTTKRVLQLRVHPLNPLELINLLCKKTPIYKEEEEAMNLWWLKTPLCRRRLKAIETLLIEEEEMKAKQANQKKKKNN